MPDDIKLHPDDPDSPEQLAKEVREQLEREIALATSWRQSAHRASRYYRSDQYRRRRELDFRRTNMVLNYVRREADQYVAAVLDAEPVVTPWGRKARDTDFARTMVDVLAWTRDEEEDYHSDLERSITDTVHLGEGVLYEGWDAFADEGRGLPVTRYYDSRYVYWDSGADRVQRDDAEYVLLLEHLATKEIRKQWELDDEPQPEGLELFLTSAAITRARRRLGAELEGGSGVDGIKRAWVIRRWKKYRAYERRFFRVGEAHDETNPPLSRGDWEALDEAERDTYVELAVPDEQLWETVTCGDQLLEHHVSPFCRTRGGHGHYPFGFMPGIALRDEPRGYGEIGFLIGLSDVRNEVISMVLDQAFLANSGYLNVVSGSVSQEMRERVNRIGKDFPLVIETQQGMPPPNWQGISPSNVSSFQQLMPLIDSMQDRSTGHGPFDRGELISSSYSGRAIRALQAQADQLGVSLRKHIEAGMKRVTILRLHNISQFMRGARVAEIVNADSGETEQIYIGDSPQEIAVTYGLQMQMNPQTGKQTMLTPDGKPARILVLSDAASRDNVLDRIRLKLDTDREMNRIEREEAARQVIQIAGPGALEWYIRQMGDVLSDSDTLLGDIQRFNGAQQLQAKLDELGKKSGMPPDELLGMLERSVASGGQAQGPGPRPPGVPMPPGAPQPIPQPPSQPQPQPQPQGV